MSFKSILTRLAPSSDSQYGLLPTQSTTPHHHNGHRCHHSHQHQQQHDTSCRSFTNITSIPRRYTRISICVFVGLILYLSLSSYSARRNSLNPLNNLDSEDTSAFPPESWATLDGKPPTYHQYLEYEKQLPAHDEELPYPDGKDAKFIYFGNHQWGVGWGNVLQEMIYNAFFAYHVKRSFVFYNYSWSLDEPSFSEYHGHLIPSRIPLTALISGPIVGGPMGKDDTDVPRSVSLDYFNQVCPQRDRYVFSDSDVGQILNTYNPIASQLLSRLSEKVNSIDARCIEIPQQTHQIFNFMLFGSKRILETWDLVRKSPIYTKFGWSPLVHAAYGENRQLFEVETTSMFSSLFSPVVNLFSSLFSSSSSPASAPSPLPPPPSSPPPNTTLTALEPPFKPLPGLLVLHIRRGDYKEHCLHFVTYKSEYNGYNSFDDLPDHFVPPQSDEDQEESIDEYLKRCFPSIPQIVERVAQVRERVKGLKRVYIMTNGNRAWLSELKDALAAAGEWETIATSKDLVLSWEQKPISQALDMFVGQRAQAFIGNGFSSMTSNIVMFRMGNSALRSNDTFFW
ncbi:hypothetical protein JOM56_007151 [Amanita muscaria]